ncbi:GIY-YIG nuclease family protein [Solimonas sp. C16B3]|uniref:GIY-YIG nuclease family protein n=1 Tax=Solimonas marina TaxID=2714601 RepID=A0A970B5A2_9GAMM|nr:GIY-YIG nuclease family protein [Solimonas marina]
MTDNINYFGSADAALIARDFTDEQRKDFTVRRVELWASTTATEQAVNRMEVELIRQWNANHPDIGYNRWPRFDKDRQSASNTCIGGIS